jgi:hypothetical protein
MKFLNLIMDKAEGDGGRPEACSPPPNAVPKVNTMDRHPYPLHRCDGAAQPPFCSGRSVDGLTRGYLSAMRILQNVLFCYLYPFPGQAGSSQPSFLEGV